MLFGIVPPPDGVVSFQFDTPALGGGVLALPQVLQLSPIPVIFALFMTDFFDTMVTMIAVAQEGEMLDEEGRDPNAKRILLIDSLVAVGGGSLGASSVTSYIESGSGVAVGGRTGLTSVAVGLLFWPSPSRPSSPCSGFRVGTRPPGGRAISSSPRSRP